MSAFATRVIKNIIHAVVSIKICEKQKQAHRSTKLRFLSHESYDI